MSPNTGKEKVLYIITWAGSLAFEKIFSILALKCEVKATL